MLIKSSSLQARKERTQKAYYIYLFSLSFLTFRNSFALNTNLKRSCINKMHQSINLVKNYRKLFC